MSVCVQRDFFNRDYPNESFPDQVVYKINHQLIRRYGETCDVETNKINTLQSLTK
jgi:hypothetical protein